MLGLGKSRLGLGKARGVAMATTRHTKAASLVARLSALVGEQRERDAEGRGTDRPDRPR